MKQLAIFFSLLWWSLALTASGTPGNILERAEAKIKSSRSIYVTYDVTADGHTAEGLLTVSGDRFTISSPQMKTWYDGQTQWTYSSHIGEVNVITPTPDELSQVNPFAILSSFKRDYKPSVLSHTKTETTYHLSALKSGTDIRTVELSISNTTLYPTRVILGMSNGQKVTIKIQDVHPGGELPVSNFRFDAKKYPGIQVVDLR